MLGQKSESLMSWIVIRGACFRSFTFTIYWGIFSKLKIQLSLEYFWLHRHALKIKKFLLSVPKEISLFINHGFQIISQHSKTFLKFIPLKNKFKMQCHIKELPVMPTTKYLGSFTCQFNNETNTRSKMRSILLTQRRKIKFQ